MIKTIVISKGFEFFNGEGWVTCKWFNDSDIVYCDEIIYVTSDDFSSDLDSPSHCQILRNTKYTLHDIAKYIRKFMFDEKCSISVVWKEV